MRQAWIDGGREFDWNGAAEDYARFRDIYPPEFYARLRAAGVAAAGQKVLELGTRTGASAPAGALALRCRPRK